MRERQAQARSHTHRHTDRGPTMRKSSDFGSRSCLTVTGMSPPPPPPASAPPSAGMCPRYTLYTGVSERSSLASTELSFLMRNGSSSLVGSVGSARCFMFGSRRLYNQPSVGRAGTAAKGGGGGTQKMRTTWWVGLLLLWPRSQHSHEHSRTHAHVLCKEEEDANDGWKGDKHDDGHNVSCGQS